MSELLVIDVEGDPVTQGSKRIGRGAGGRPILIEDRDGPLRKWRGKVTDAVRDRIGSAWTPLDEPVLVDLTFRFTRPPSHLTKAGALRAWAPTLPCTQSSGDADKIARAVLDAITAAKFWVDDSRVVDLNISKRYAHNDPRYGSRPGVLIEIHPAT